MNSIPIPFSPIGQPVAPYVQDGLQASYSYRNSSPYAIYDTTGNGYDLEIQNRDSSYLGEGIKDIKAKAVKAMDWLDQTCTVELLFCGVEDFTYSPEGKSYGLGGFTSNPVNIIKTGACISGMTTVQPFSWRSPTLNGDSNMVAPTQVLQGAQVGTSRALNVAFTVAPTNCRGYLNGSCMSKINAVVNFTGDKLFKLGVNVIADQSTQWGELNRFPYTFLAARVYSRALSWSELAANFKADVQNYGLSWNQKFESFYFHTNAEYTAFINSNNQNNSYPIRNVFDLSPVVTGTPGGDSNAWITANNPGFPVKISIAPFPPFYCRSVTLYQLANPDGGTRDVQLFADADLFDPISSVYTLPNCVTKPASVIPGDPVGTPDAYGASVTIPVNRLLNGRLTIAVQSKWGIYYAGLQEIEIDGYYV